MSLLSKTEYNKINNTIQQFTEEIQQESIDLGNKIELALAKINILQQTLEDENQKIMNQSANQLLKIHQVVKQKREELAKMIQKHNSRIKIRKEDIAGRLSEIEKLEKSNRSGRLQLVKEVQLQLEKYSIQILSEEEKESERIRREIEELSKKLGQEVKGCQRVIMQSRKKIKNQEEKTIQKIIEISQDLGIRIKQLSDARRKKKLKFLNLFETVIEKIKETETVQPS